MNSTDTADLQSNTVVTCVIFLIGLLGIGWNSLAICIVYRNPVLKNSFGLLCVSHSLANLGVLVVFVIWCGPLTALQDHQLAADILGKRLGQINIFFWDACVYSHLAVSINRLITISFPQKKILTVRNTGFILGIVWLLGAIHATPYWWHNQCYLTYDPASWTWNFAVTECGYYISMWFDYYSGVSVFIVITLMDLATFSQLRRTNSNVARGQTDAFREKRRKIEQRFFLQTVIQGCIFFYELVNFYWAYTLDPHPLYIYFTTSFAWELCHALDGRLSVPSMTTQNQQSPTAANKQQAPIPTTPSKNVKSPMEDKQQMTANKTQTSGLATTQSMKERKQKLPSKTSEMSAKKSLDFPVTPSKSSALLHAQKSKHLPDDLKPLTRQRKSKEPPDVNKPKTRRSSASTEGQKKTQKSKDSMKTAKAVSNRKSKSQERQARKKGPLKKTQTDTQQSVQKKMNKSTRNKKPAGTTAGTGTGAVATDDINSEEEEDYHERSDSEGEEVQTVETQGNVEKEQVLVVEKISRMGRYGTLAKNRLSFLFIILAFLNGYDVLCRYTFNINHYGNAFVFVYMAVMIVVGFPLIYMEYVLGQYSVYTSYNIFRRIAPAFTGVGVVSLFLNFVQMLTDQMMMPYFLDLVYHTSNFFADSMPWHNCISDYNTPACRDVHHTCEKWQKTYAEMPDDVRGNDSYSSIGNLCYLSRMRTQRMDSFDDWQLKNINEQPLHKWLAGESMGQHLLWNVKITEKTIGYSTWPTPPFLMSMLSAWLAIYFICKYFRKHIGKLATFSWIFCMSAMITLAIWILLAEPPEYTYLPERSLFDEDFMIWLRILVSAFGLTFTSLRLGQGGWAFLGSQNSFHNNAFLDCLIIFCAIIVPLFIYSMAHIMCINSYILYLVEGSMEKWKETFENITDRDKTYFFWTGYPLPQFVFYLASLRIYKEHEPLLVWILSSMGALMTLMNKVIRVEIIVATLTEIFPIMTSTLGTSCRNILLHLTICFSLLCCIYLAGPNGMEAIIGFENYMIPLLTATVVAAECICVGWCYGGLRLMSNITAMNNRRTESDARLFTSAINVITAYLWSLVVPTTIWILYLAYIWIGAEGTHTKKDLSGESMAAWIGNILIIVVFAHNAIHYHRKENNQEKIYMPQRVLWGPRSTEDRLFAEKWERKNRVTV